MANQTLAVVNPHSANGRTGREWPRIAAALERAIGPFDHGLTEGPGHATALCREALAGGAERIISIGGDGTNNEIINGFFRDGQPLNPQARLGFIPRGTGGDLRRTLGVGLKLADCLPLLERDRTRPIDLGRCRFSGPDGQPLERLFINITSFGLGGLVDRAVNESSKALGGKTSFLLGTLRALWRYRNRRVRLKVDAAFDRELLINNIAVANGRFHGGGMQVAPTAAPDDGLFDVVVLGDLTKPAMLRLSRHIYKGGHLAHPKVFHLQGRRVEADSDEEVLIDMDGEQPGRLPITLDILPAALKVIA